MNNGDLFEKSVFAYGDSLPTLALSLLAGCVAGFMFDLSGMIKRLFGTNAVVDVFLDFLTVLATYSFIFLSALNFSHGVIRWYDIFSAIIGYIIYKKLLSKLFSPIFSAVYIAIDYLAKTAKFMFGKILSLVFSVSDRVITRISRLFENGRNKRAYKKKKKSYIKNASGGFSLFR